MLPMKELPISKDYRTRKKQGVEATERFENVDENFKTDLGINVTHQAQSDGQMESMCQRLKNRTLTRI